MQLLSLLETVLQKGSAHLKLEMVVLPAGI